MFTSAPRLKSIQSILKSGQDKLSYEVDTRAKTASTIFCSQFGVPGWHENLYDPTLTDVICDRIVYDSYIIRIEGNTKREQGNYGINKLRGD